MSRFSKISSRSILLVGVLSVVFAVLALAALAALVYLWIILGDRGLNADATGVSGYTTSAESALLIVCGVGLIPFSALSITCAVVFLRKRRVHA